MHIPDGFLATPVNITTAVVSAGFIGMALRETYRKIEPEKIKYIVLLTAFIFGAQMINFNILSGTSGHFLGAALAAILFGHWVAILIMSVVLSTQCIFFADGGITALGSNIFNMAIIGSFSAYYVYRFLLKKITGKVLYQYAVYGFSAFVSIVCAAFLCSFELAISGLASPVNIFANMISVHSLIGMAEGIITAGILYVITLYQQKVISV